MNIQKLVFSILAAFSLSLSVSAQKFETDTIYMNGPLNNRINFVFLGDGYLDEQLDQYIEDVRMIADDLLQQTPFEDYNNYFNIIAIKVPSEEEGAAMDPGSLINNYFGSSFNAYGIERLLVPYRSNRIYSVLADNFPEYDQVFLLVNSDKYGGSGGAIATSSTNVQAREIGIHELGHSFGGLSDEYWAGEQYARENINMTQNNDPETVSWKEWYQSEGVGIYQHSGHPWYRPHQNCKMRYLGVPFCAVCRQEITHRIINHVDQLKVIEPDPGVINFRENFWLKLDILEPSGQTFKRIWYIDGVQQDSQADSLFIDLAAFEPGDHAIRFIGKDTIGYIRKKEMKDNIEHLLNWSFRASGTGIYDLKCDRLSVNMYPNPVEDVLFLNLKSNTTQKLIITVSTLTGKTLTKHEFNSVAGQESIKSINLEKLAFKGWIFVNIQGDQLNMSRKILIQ